MRKAPDKAGPQFGANLAALRRAAALTQAELAAAIGASQQNVAFWEKSQRPPRADIVARLAAALGVRVEALLDHAPSAPLRIGSGPVGQVQKAFEEVRSLPRHQQQQVLAVVSALLAQFKREAS